MNFNVLYTSNFRKEAKKLTKKYPSIKHELSQLIESLEQDAEQGVALGKDCYKIRIAIKSKGKGKSGGARVITCVKIVDSEVYLLSIYDKSEQASLTDKALKELLKEVE